MSFNKVEKLKTVYKALEVCTTFMRPALPFVNSHLTDFFINNYWDGMLPPCVRDNLESMSVAEVKSGLKDFVNGNWRNYYARSCSSSSALLHNNLTFENAKTFQELVIATASLQLSELDLSVPLKQLCFNGVGIYDDSATSPGENVLKLDKIMSAKKTHEVEVMSDLIKKIAESALVHPGNNDKGKCIEYLVDLGSGKGYLSSYLTLLHKFKLLAVDSSSINSMGCEKRSAKLEKAWAQLVKRAVERQMYGKCSKRGKHWKSQKQTTPLPTTITSGPDSHNNEQINSSASGFGGDGELGGRNTGGESQINENCGSAESRKSQANMTIQSSSTSVDQIPSNNSRVEYSDNKLLQTLTQFVTLDFDLTTTIREKFSTFTTTSDNEFGLVGLHTCGNLGVASLKLFISNENAKFICNVPCCFHLLDEKNLFYPSKNFYGSPALESEMVECNLKPSFPISQKLDVDDSTRFCLGSNSRIMSAYSLPKMMESEKGFDLHPSIFYRSVLQVLIKKALGDDFESSMNSCEQRVGKMGDKCTNFPEYVRMGLRNLHLDSQIQLTDVEIDVIYNDHVHQGKDRLLKYYLLRSLFSSIVEGIILLDRLAFLLEQDKVAEAHIVELFDASVSPRCQAIVALKTP